MANPSRKKRPKSGAFPAEDRISNLPDSIIDHIFSFLPTVDVIATSVLSKRWKYLWTKLTTLNFIQDAAGEKNLPEDGEVTKFVRFVNKVSLHISSQRLQKFRLKWWEGLNFDPEYVSIWTGFAISRCVRVLVIDLGYSDQVTWSWSIDIPGALFTSGTLEVLKIHGFIDFKVPSVVCLPKLEVLCLKHLCYDSSECIPMLLGGSPVLHTLEIGTESSDSMRDFKVFSTSLRRFKIHRADHNFTCVGKLEIDAPNLEHFDVHEKFEECSAKRLDSVNFAALDLDVSPDRDCSFEDAVLNRLSIDRCNSAVKLVETLKHVKFLTLRGTILDALNYATIPLTACFDRLIELDVSVKCCYWSSLSVLLGRFPKLQVLEIMKVGCFKTNHKLCWSNPTKVPKCLSSTLEKFLFINFRGLEDEMTMMKYILQHGEVLESVTLMSAGDHDDYKNRFKMVQRLSTFPRVSRACQVHFD